MRFVKSLVFGVAFTLLSARANGQTFNITSGSAAWNVNGNWTPSGFPNAIDASATFGSPTAVQTVTMSQGITIGSLAITNNAANILTLSNGVGGSLTFSASSGNATLTLGGSSAATNNLTISASVALASTLDATDNQAGQSGLTNAAGLSFTGAMTGSGGFIKNGVGRASMTTVAHAYAGATVVNQGRLRFTATGVANGTSSIAVNNGGMLMLDTNAGAFNFGTAAITLNGAGTTETVQNLGALRNQNSGAVTLSNAVALATDSTIHSEILTGSLQLNGAFSGAGALTKTGAGNLIVANAASSHSGAVTINAGTVAYNAGVAIGGGNVTLAQSAGSNATLAINSNQTIGNLATSWTDTTGTFLQTASLGGNALTVVQTGNTTFGNGAVPALQGVITGAGGSLVLGAGSTGSLSLTGANTYTGGTTINAGTLLANNATGSATGAGAVAVNAAGTLGGAGSVAGLVTVNGGTISPGNSPGLLTLNGGLTMNTGAYKWELAALSTGNPGVDFDQIAVGGGTTATLGGTSAVTLSFLNAIDPTNGDPFWNVSEQWRILDTTGATLSGIFAGIGNPTYSTGFFTLTSDATGVLLNWTFVAVPEPGTVLLTGLAGAAALLFRRRRAPPTAA